MSLSTIRFGYSDSIHLLSLLHPLLAGWVYPNGFRLELVDLPPAELGSAIAAGTLDGALLDPVIFARLRSSVEPLPGIGLASEGSNAAAVLSSGQRADDLDGANIAVEASAAGGMAEVLLKVLLEPYFGISAKLVEPGAAEAPQARVSGGDDALRARAPWLRYEAQFSQPDAKKVSEPDPAQAGYATDLGAAWWVLTGTPLVWALGAVRQQLLDNEKAVVELVRAFRESRRSATQQYDTVIAAAAKKTGVDEAAIRAAFAAQHVEIGPRDHGGLGLLYENTRRVGIR